MKYRLGLDVGTNSLGWAVYELSPSGQIKALKAMSARIYADGRDAKSKESLATDRRLARSARRRRDRYLRRREVLLEELVRLNLMPADEGARKALAALEPLALRAKALDEALPPHHIGRLLFHLNQRRGFKSNRKADRKNDEKGKINIGISELHQDMEKRNARTYGEYLFMRAEAGGSTRARLKEDEKAYSFYPERGLLVHEFREIWAAQKKYHPNILTDAAYERLHDVIFYQRPLKVPEVGRCTFFAEEKRLPKAHPLFQQRRLYEEVNALEIARAGESARKLTLDERERLINKLKGKKSVAFESLRKALNLPPDMHFNKESNNRTKLTGDEVAAEMAHKTRFGNAWAHLSWEQQWRIIERGREEEKPDALHAWLKDHYNLDDDAAQAVADAHLPEGYGRFGLSATQAILRELKQDVIVYSKAVERADDLPHHSDFRDGEIWDELPYYGRILERHMPPGSHDPKDPVDKRYGRITNPTVHIGLGQIRRVLNALIKRYGHPEEIVVELARDLKLNERQKAEVNKRIKVNTEAAEKRSKKLEELGQVDNGRNRLMLRLWEELNPKDVSDRCCPYCRAPIGVEALFSSATDIDHILPYSKTLDDSPVNKVVCHAHCNRDKSNRTPYDAFGGDEARWDKIAANAKRLAPNKRWRFAPDALEQFEHRGGFLGRQLNETQYLAKMARNYLTAICPKGVWVVPGQLTEMLRRHWGLNAILSDHNHYDVTKKKNRNDHRHHIIDACVVAAIDRGLLQRIATQAARHEDQGMEDVIGSAPPPWDGFREDVQRALAKVVISHRPDHGTIKPGATSGRLHNDTAYGLTGEEDERGNPLVIHRVPLSSLKASKDLMKIRDDSLRDALWDALWDATQGLSGKEFEAALKNFAKTSQDYKKLRRVRIIEPLNVIPIRDKNGKAYKGYKGDANFRYDVWRTPDGKWQADVITRFEAHQSDFDPQKRRPHPAAKKILSLRQGDMLAIEEDSKRKIMRVVKFGQNGQIALAPHNEANVDARNRDKQDSFKMLRPAVSSLNRLRARQVRVDELGRLFDPRFTN